MKLESFQVDTPAEERLSDHTASKVCPNCATQNPPQSKFCGECGSSLTVGAQPQQSTSKSPEHDFVSRLQKYLPEGLTERVLSQKDRLGAELRHVTIMFVDMKGFTPLTEMLGLEETFSLMDKMYEILIHKVHDYQGTVMELRGDGILAFFGAPYTLEEAPQRAIRSALAIHDEMIGFNEAIDAKRNIPNIQVRIGINSGPVVVGSVGNDVRVQFTAVGDAINMAARMEQIAQPGTTYVTEQTFRHAEGFFEFEALGAKQIKGKSQPLNVYRVIASTMRQTRFDVSSVRGLTHFVGRKSDLSRMVRTFETVKDGKGQALSLVGEAGVGKSRLLYEFRRMLADEDVTYFRGRCLSYGRGTAYLPIIDLLKSNLDIRDDDNDEDIKTKTKKLLRGLGVDEVSHLPYLLELLSVKETGLDRIRTSQEQVKAGIIQALSATMLNLARTRPLILAFEDLHWMDTNSEDTISYLLAHIADAQVMIILTYRPDFVASWNHASHHWEIHLDRLSSQETMQVLHSMLGCEKIDHRLTKLVLEKTEGVPLYIEEFVRALRDMQAIKQTKDRCGLEETVRGLDIPSTIHEVIMARVDFLHPQTKKLLQVASVIEREFSLALLKTVTGFSDQELLPDLSSLQEKEILYQKGIFPECSYAFRHSLIREVVYSSILTKRRKDLHGRIGKAIEKVFCQGIETYYSQLADHFFVSEDYEKSAEYSRLTIEAAQKQAAMASAISYADRRISALEKLSESKEVQSNLIEARMDHAISLFMQGYLAKSRHSVTPVADAVLHSEDNMRRGQLKLIMGSCQFAIDEEFCSGLDCLNSAVEDLEASSDIMSAILANAFYGLALCWNCQFEKGAERIGKALWFNEAAQVPWGISYMKSNLSYYSYNYQGRVNEGFATSLQALETAESSADILSLAVAQVCHGMSCFYKGYFSEAVVHLLEGVELCERIHLNSFTPVAHQGLGFTYFQTGEYSKAREHHEKAVLLRQETGIFPSCANLNRVAAARAAVAGGEAPSNLPSLEEFPRLSPSRLYHGTMARCLADILRNLEGEKTDQALCWIEVATKEHERLGMNWDLAADYMLLGQLLRTRGRDEEGLQFMDESRELFRDCGADGWCRRIENDCGHR